MFLFLDQVGMLYKEYYNKYYNYSLVKNTHTDWEDYYLTIFDDNGEIMTSYSYVPLTDTWFYWTKDKHVKITSQFRLTLKALLKDKVNLYNAIMKLYDYNTAVVNYTEKGLRGESKEDIDIKKKIKKARKLMLKEKSLCKNFQ
jgi:hypothetical protein